MKLFGCGCMTYKEIVRSSGVEKLQTSGQAGAVGGTECDENKS
jgi:hypothetical protein